MNIRQRTPNMSLILTLASFYLAVCEKVSEDLTNMKVKLVVPVFFFCCALASSTSSHPRAARTLCSAQLNASLLTGSEELPMSRRQTT